MVLTPALIEPHRISLNLDVKPISSFRSKILQFVTAD